VSAFRPCVDTNTHEARTCRPLTAGPAACLTAVF